MTDKAIPILPSHDLHRTVTMYRRIGFRQVARYDAYVILERGAIELHFSLRDDHDPTVTAGVAYLRVDDVNAFYAGVVAAGFENWHLQDPSPDVATRWEAHESIARITALESKPWGLTEFALLDEDNNLIRIGQVRSKA